MILIRTKSNRLRINIIIFSVLYTMIFWSDVFANSITKENWLKHPDIIEVRKIFKDVNSLIEKKKLLLKKKDFEYCEPYQDTDRLLYLDPKTKNVRKYVFSGGSDDSARTIEAYYSPAGKIRFAYNRGAHATNVDFEYRIYFNKNSEIIWRVFKLTVGEKVTVEYAAHSMYENEIPYDPISDFETDNICPEIK